MAAKQFYTGADVGAISLVLWRDQMSKATSYTVVAADNGKLFDTTGAAGAITFTLPALARGLAFGFFNVVDQNMIVVRAGTDVIIADGNAAATTLTYSTGSHKIGSFSLVYANADGTKWLHENRGATLCTVS